MNILDNIEENFFAVARYWGGLNSPFDLGVQAPQKLFLAHCDGKPAATSLLFTHKNATGIYYGSTLPFYRNKGLGLLIILAAMQAAKESGFRNVILQATSLGAKV